ncbi:MAG: ATP-binding protein [Oscillospiraceae bacterium]|nr:ATP-binding protein [Oscillospiraceae bacterium]
MMDELSLNILDIAQNSISAEASEIEIYINEDYISDRIIICVKDNGKGMSEDFLKTVEDPFITTRTTRKIGLGISFLKEAAEITGGSMEIISELGAGTTITAVFVLSHIDRQPIGNLTETIITLVTLNPGINFIFRYRVNEEEFIFSTKEVKEQIGDDTPLDSPSIVVFLTEYVNEHILNLTGGAS